MNKFIFGLFLILIASACSLQPQTPSQRYQEEFSIQARKERAQTLVEQKRYQQALSEYEILQMLEPENADLVNRANILRASIQRQNRSYKLLAEKALAQNHKKRARQLLYKALALQPNDAETLAQLRTLDEKKQKSIQSARTRKLQESLHKNEPALSEAENYRQQRSGNFQLELAQSLFNDKDWEGGLQELKRFLQNNPKDRRAITLARTAYEHLLEELRTQQQWEALIDTYEQALVYADNTRAFQYRQEMNRIKEKLSEAYYLRGMQAYKNDVDLAIDHWEQALQYNPRHNKAKLRLNKAYQIRRKLNQIMVDSEK